MNGLRLETYRRKRRFSKLAAAEKRLLASLEEELEAVDEPGLELVDVVDEGSGEATYLLVFWPFGSGVLVSRASGEVVADVIQHHFDARGDDALRARLATAFERDRAALGIRESVEFRPGAAPPPKAAVAKGGVRESIAAMRREIAEGRSPGDQAIWALVQEAIDVQKQRYLPFVRPFELDATQREALELVHEGMEASATMLPNAGLPSSVGRQWRRDPANDPGDLARYLGHAPLGPLDETVMIEGHAHPAWCLLGDAVHELAPAEQVLEQLGALPLEKRVALWGALARKPGARLTGAYATPPKGAQRGSPVSNGLHACRFTRLVRALGVSLGEAGMAAARALLAEHADWVTRWGPGLAKSPTALAPHHLGLVVALATLAHATAARGEELDASHDPLLEALASSRDASYPIAVVLEDLPLARAQRIARHQLELLELFPAPESTDAAIARLEALGGGPHAGAIFTRVVTSIGAPARAPLEAAIARPSPVAADLKKALRALGKAAPEKKPAPDKKPARP